MQFLWGAKKKNQQCLLTQAFSFVCWDRRPQEFYVEHLAVKFEEIGWRTIWGPILITSILTKRSLSLINARTAPDCPSQQKQDEMERDWEEKWDLLLWSWHRKRAECAKLGGKRLAKCISFSKSFELVVVNLVPHKDALATKMTHFKNDSFKFFSNEIIIAGLQTHVNVLMLGFVRTLLWILVHVSDLYYGGSWLGNSYLTPVTEFIIIDWSI